MKMIFCIVIAILIVSPGYSQTNNRKAKEYYFSGCDKVYNKDYIGAIADFSEAIKLDSGFIQAFENRGVAKFYLRDYIGAIADYTKALLINPNDYSTLGRRGWAKFYVQEYQEAITDFTKAIEGRKNTVGYYNIRGQSKYYINDYEGAIEDFSKVIKIWAAEKNQKSKAFYWRGMAKIELGENESGCLDLSKAGKLRYSEAYEAIKKYCQ